MSPQLKTSALVTILFLNSFYAFSQEVNRETAQELLRQASRLVADVPEMQRMSVASNIANAQARAGNLADALSTIRLLKKPQDFANGMGSIASFLDYSGDLPAALQLIQDESWVQSQADSYAQIAESHARKGDFSGALRVAHLIRGNPARSVEALAYIAQLQWKSGERADADTIWDEVFEVAQKAWKQDSNLAILLVGIATSHAEAGDTATAYAVLDKFNSLIHERHPADQGLLSTLAMGYANLGDTTNSLQTVEALTPGSNRDICLMTISGQLMKKNDAADAEEVISHISDPELKAHAFQEIAISQAGSGRPGPALEVLEKIPNLAARADALAVLALEQAEQDDNAASETLGRAVTTANKSTPKPPEHVFATIAVVEAILGDFDKAQATVRPLSSEARPWAWWNITEMMVNTGDLSSALKIAAEEKDPHAKAYALLGSANGIIDQLRSKDESKEH